MNLPLFIGVLLAMEIGCISACSHSNHNEQLHLHEFRAKVLHKMKMANEQIEQIPLESVVEVRKMLPMIEDHSHKETDTIYIVEEKTVPMASDDHLFHLPSSVADRYLMDVSLSLHLSPSHSPSLMTVFVQARELQSDIVYPLATHEFTTSRHPKQLTLKVDKQLVKRWIESPSPSIVLSFGFRAIDSDVMMSTDEVVTSDKSIVMELTVATPSTRKRRAVTNKCKKGEPNQECCIRERIVSFKDLGINNMISPMTTVVSWCEGACHKESSFQHLFDGYTTKVLDGGKAAARCCHATEAEDIDVLFINEKKEVKQERLYGVVVKKCACA